MEDNMKNQSRLGSKKIDFLITHLIGFWIAFGVSSGAAISSLLLMRGDIYVDIALLIISFASAIFIILLKIDIAKFQILDAMNTVPHEEYDKLLNELQELRQELKS